MVIFINRKMKRVVSFVSAAVLLLTFFLPLPGTFFIGTGPAFAAMEENPLLWRKSWCYTEYQQYPGGIATDSQGNIYVTVYKGYNATDQPENKLVKFNVNGEELWQITLPSAVSWRSGVAIDRDVAVYVCDATKLYKINPENGVIVWTVDISSTYTWPVISTGSGGGVYLAFNKKSDTGYDVVLSKYLSDGNKSWEKTIGTDSYDFVLGISAENPWFVNVVGMTNGTFTGNSASGTPPFMDYFVASFGPDGSEKWIRQNGFGKNWHAEPKGIATDNKGNIYITVTDYFTWAGRSKNTSWLCKYSLAGNLDWMEYIADYPVDVAVDPVGSIYTFRYEEQWVDGGIDFDLSLFQYHPNGLLNWQKTVDTSGSYADYIITGENGSVIIVGKDYPGIFLAKYEGDCKDTDEDGLTDKWETKGLTVNEEFLDLPAMGANPQRKDIFVEVDWMPGKKPHQATIDMVIQAFKDAPVENPDGSTGITLHVDIGRDSVMNSWTRETWGALARGNEVPHVKELGTKLEKLKEIKEANDGANFSEVRRAVFRYCIFGDYLDSTTSGGAGFCPGSDFAVTLGGWVGGTGTIFDQAATFMHELGHNLWLGHGGPYGKKDNYKPNYLSVMNYSFSSSGLFKRDHALASYQEGYMDYSRFDDIDLSENWLMENDGLTSASGNAELENYSTIYYYDGESYLSTGPRPIDWYVNGYFDDEVVQVDINNDGNITDLKSYNDWVNLYYKGGTVGQLAKGIEQIGTTFHPDITAEEQALLPHPYRVAVLSPKNTASEPGGSVTHTFTVVNQGDNADTYLLEASTSTEWANLSGVPASVELMPGESIGIVIPVTIPTWAPTGAENELKLSAVSQSSPRIWDTGTVVTIVKPKGVGSETRITNKNEPSNLYPTVSGDWIVWLAQWEGIWAYNVSTGVLKKIAAFGSPHIDGTRVVYSKETKNADGTTDPSDVYMYDLATDVERRITSAPGMQIDPRIHGDRIVWQDNRLLGDADIYMFDLSTNSEQRITTNPKNQYRPDINGDRIVWEDHRNVNSWATPYNYDIYMFDLATGTERQITTHSYVQRNPRIFEDTIVWWDQRNDSGDIYLYNLSTDTERGLNKPGYQATPDIDRHRIVYTDWTSGDVFMYDLKTDTDTQITNHARNQYEPAIQGMRIVYRDERNTGTGYNTDIYMTNLILGEPVTNISTTPTLPRADGWFATRPEITLTADRGGVSTYFQWDSTSPSGWSGYTVPFTVPEGEHTLYYYSADKAGNMEGFKSAVFRVDSTPPETVINSTPAYDEQICGVFKSVPQITLGTDEPGTTWYQWDAIAADGWIAYSGAITGMEGEHTLYFYSTDARGNAETVKSRLFIVDTSIDETAPQTSISSDPGFPENNGLFREIPVITLSTDELAVIYYQWDAPPDIESGQVYPPVKITGGMDPLYSSDTFGPTAYRGRFLAPEGEHTLYYFSVDAAGNVEAIQSRTFNVDLSQLQVTITSPSLLQEVEGSVLVQGNVSSTPETVFLTVYGQTPIPLTLSAENTFTYTLDTSRFAAGMHLLTVSAEDYLGNKAESSVTINVLPDTLPPDTEILTCPAVNTNQRDASFTFTGTDNRTHQWDLRYFHKLDGVDEDYVLSSSTMAAYTGLPDGTYTFRVKAVDWAGNIDPTEAAWTYTVERTEPAPGVNVPSGDYVYMEPFIFSYNDPSLKLVGATLNGTAIEPGTLILNKLGDNTLVVTVEDTFGNTFTQIYSFHVSYKVGWKQPLHSFDDGSTAYTMHDGSTLPIRWVLMDYYGNLMTDPTVTVRVSSNENPENHVVLTAGTVSDTIRYDEETGQYVVNLHTRNYPWMIASASDVYIVELHGVFDGERFLANRLDPTGIQISSTGRAQRR